MFDRWKNKSSNVVSKENNQIVTLFDHAFPVINLSILNDKVMSDRVLYLHGVLPSYASDENDWEKIYDGFCEILAALGYRNTYDNINRIAQIIFKDEPIIGLKVYLGERNSKNF